MAITVRTPPSAAVVEIEVDGKITRSEIERVFAEIEAALEGRTRLKVLEDIRSLDGIEPAALWRDVLLGLPLMNRISHAAVVTDARWLRALSEMTRHFVPEQVRTFASEELAAARAWLAAA